MYLKIHMQTLLANGYGYVVDHLMVYNFKIWWVGAYRGMDGYWKEYGNFNIPLYHNINIHVMNHAWPKTTGLINQTFSWS